MKAYKVEQRSEDWFNLRKGKITGTDLKKIVSSKTRDNFLYEVIAERLMVGTPTQENAMDRGVRLESEAIKEFEKQTGKIVEYFGLTESDENEYIASSPDGLIKNGEEYTEAVEVKCLAGGKHTRIWIENKIPDEYLPQITQYFIVNPELETLYFVSYDPSIKVHPLHIVVMKREEMKELIETYSKLQKDFLKEVESKLEKVIQF